MSTWPNPPVQPGPNYPGKPEDPQPAEEEPMDGNDE